MGVVGTMGGVVRRVRNAFTRLPRRVVRIVGLLAVLNIVVWVVVIAVLCALKQQSLLSTAALAYSLGLRHALDADHITAIDLATRRLVAIGRKPVSVGTFFSLGHSTIVIITCLVVAASSASISDRFGSFSSIGGIIGSSVSTAFLLILGVFNTYTLWVLGRRLRRYIDGAGCQGTEEGPPAVMVGPIGRACKGLFRLIDRPWKLYPIGVLFGLGFDTSSEIALLGIASLQGSHGTSIWLILVFPALFTVGMCLVDTLDGAMMGCVYTMHDDDDDEERDATAGSRIEDGECGGGGGGGGAREQTVRERLDRRIDDGQPQGILFSQEQRTLSTNPKGCEDGTVESPPKDSPTGTDPLLDLEFDRNPKEQHAHLSDQKLPFADNASFTPSLTASGIVPSPLPPRRRPKKIPLAYLYYSTILTCLTSIIALFIGTIQLLTLLQNAIKPPPSGKFWDGVSAIGDAYDVLGGVICGVFVVVLGMAACGWGRFKVWAERRRAR